MVINYGAGFGSPLFKFMRTFKSKSVKDNKRHFGFCTEIQACEAEEPPIGFEECDRSFIEPLSKLFTQDGVTYYGHL